MLYLRNIHDRLKLQASPQLYTGLWILDAVGLLKVYARNLILGTGLAQASLRVSILDKTFQILCCK